MWQELIARLTARAPRPEAPLPDLDERLALGALLVRMAMADNHYDAVEIGQIDRILAASFGLKPVEAAKMRATCEKLERAAPGTPEFARMIRETVPEAQRRDALAGLWSVALADGYRDASEAAILDVVRADLGLDDAADAEARARAVAGLDKS